MADESTPLLQGYCKIGGEAIAGATVRWRHTQEGPAYETTTDAQGHYAFGGSSFPAPPIKYAGVSAAKVEGSRSLAAALTFFWSGEPKRIDLEMTVR